MDDDDQQTPSSSDPMSSASEAISSATTPPPAGSVGLGQGTLPEKDEKTMGLLAHILGGITSFLGPLIIWLIKKDESPFVNDQGKEALNFQITVVGAWIAIGILSFIVAMAQIPAIGCVIVLVQLAVGVGQLVLAILGGLAANKGTVYRYPFAVRLIK